MNVIIDKAKLQALIDAGGELYHWVTVSRMSHDEYADRIMNSWEGASDPKNLTAEIKRGEPEPVAPDGWSDARDMGGL
jgi:hypothetical protein